jgi:hypothetical protein
MNMSAYAQPGCTFITTFTYGLDSSERPVGYGVADAVGHGDCDTRAYEGRLSGVSDALQSTP